MIDATPELPSGRGWRRGWRLLGRDVVCIITPFTFRWWTPGRRPKWGQIKRSQPSQVGPDQVSTLNTSCSRGAAQAESVRASSDRV